MDKKLLLKEMLQNKDPKRKKMLFEVFENEIHFSASSQFVAQFINKELGIENLVSSKDVEYCRYNFKQKNKAKNEVPKIPNTRAPVKSNPIHDSNEIIWTNPDEINSNPYKSKF